MVGHPNYTVILNTVINDTPKIAKEILMNKCLIFRIAVKYIARHEKNKSSQCLSVSNYIYISFAYLQIMYKFVIKQVVITSIKIKH